MMLRHGNRIRRGRGKRMVRELQAAEAYEFASSGPTEAEIRHRAHEIYVRRAGGRGNPMADWLRAENELRARKADALWNDIGDFA